MWVNLAGLVSQPKPPRVFNSGSPIRASGRPIYKTRGARWGTNPKQCDAKRGARTAAWLSNPGFVRGGIRQALILCVRSGVVCKTGGILLWGVLQILI